MSPDTEAVTIAQRRQHPRRRSLKGALIVFKDGHCTIRCYILNESDTGAMLMPVDVVDCPTKFVLKPDLGESRTCEVRWRNGANMGVRFA